MTVKTDLGRLAANQSWMWRRSARELLMSLPGADPKRHPVETVAALTDAEAQRLGGDEAFMAELTAERQILEEMSSGPSPSIAYCSPEFGITDLFPQYAGGLGVLAGDHLMAASDAEIPLVGVGLLYREGAFHQAIENGEQTEFFEPVDPEKVGARDTGVEVVVPFPGRDVAARVWRLDVGGVPLILLDTDVDTNRQPDRGITDRLYLGTQQHRIDQEMILGVGGARALEALGWDIEVHHLNEGHAGFITLELIDRMIAGGDLASAVAAVRRGTVFTSHTPVPAGIDRLDLEILIPYLEHWARRWGIGVGRVWALGEDPEDPDRFNMPVFCLRMSSAANGVSELHGAVSRELFAAVPEGARIGYVTNGVHARTWTADAAQEVFDEVLGPEWAVGDPGAWNRVDDIDDDRLGLLRRRGAERLADLVAEAGGSLDPDSLIVGFARRFAPYKRANLLLKHADQLEKMLADDDRPVHFVFAGKAHPANESGKLLVSEIVRFGESASAHGRFTFIPDYSMSVASRLVGGCDLWLNNPVRPQEASGTSGEKVALNGGLNCSILDGWWAEMFDGRNGWAIAASDERSPELRDLEESAAAMAALREARDEYFAARGSFNDRIRHAWRTLGPRVTAARMVAEYDTQFYVPARHRMRSGT